METTLLLCQLKGQLSNVRQLESVIDIQHDGFLSLRIVSGSASCREAVVRSDEGDECPQMEVRVQSPEPSNVPANLQTLKYSELNKMMLTAGDVIATSSDCSSVNSTSSIASSYQKVTYPCVSCEIQSHCVVIIF